MAKVAKPFIGNEIFIGRGKQYLINYITDKNKDRNGPDKNSNDGTDDMPAQFFEMVDKGHVATRCILLFSLA